MYKINENEKKNYDKILIIKTVNLFKKTQLPDL